MKILKNKFLIPAIVVLLLSVAIFTRLSLMFADEDNGASLKTLVFDDAITEGKTIIDYIIDNSYIEDDNDPVYHVLEIGSGNTPSSLASMIDNTQDLKDRKFESLVLNGNKSAQQVRDLNEKKIEYKYLNMNYDSENANAALIEAINKADIIYFSEDMSNAWSSTNDITEEVKIALAKFATSDQRPIIFDSHNLSSQYYNAMSKDFMSLATNYYSKEGNSNSTYRWPSNVSVSGLMNPSDLRYMYLPVYGNAQSSNGTWEKGLFKSDKNPEDLNPGEKPLKDINISIAKVLTIKMDTSALTDKFKACCDSTAYSIPAGYHISEGEGLIPSDYDFSNVYKLNTSSELFDFGYYGLEARPTALKFDTCTVTKSGSDYDYSYDYSMDLSTLDYSQYDFVIIEGSLRLEGEGGAFFGAKLSEASFNALVSAMYSGVHILYDDALVRASGTGNAITQLSAQNIKYVYDKIATASDSPKFSNVLVSIRPKMDIYSKSTTAKGVKDIADIINAGSFRGLKSNANGDSSNTYTVLEIEPCYPINTALAKKLYDIRKYKDPLQKNNKDFVTQGQRQKFIGQDQYTGSSAGFYYIRTDQVSNLTSDEISYGDGYSLTSLLEDLEYYYENVNKNASDFSSTEEYNAVVSKRTEAKANIDKYFLTNQNAENTVVNAVADITDYYNWSLSRAKIAHATGRSYDQVNVVHMSSVEFATSRKTLLDNFDAIYIGGDNSAIKDTIKDNENAWYLSTISGANYYTMYFHNGDAYPINKQNATPDAGSKLNSSVSGYDYGLFAGNDLTYSKYNELITYASKMPVIIDKRLSSAFASAKINGNKQHLLDPQSNMFKFLDNIMTYDQATDKYAAVNSKLTLVNFDSSYTYKAVNPDGKYGKTYGGYVTVFRGDSPEIEYEYEKEMEDEYDYEVEYETEPDVYEVELDEEGNEKLDENGNPIYKLDENGNRIINKDADGNPIVRKDSEGNELTTIKKDEKGQDIVKKDEKGEPVYVLDENNKKIIKKDENGDPIVIGQKPVIVNGKEVFKLDAAGNKILVGYEVTGGAESNIDAYGYDFSNEKSYKEFISTANKEAVNESRLREILNNTARPLLAVISTPSIYSENDRSTWIDTQAANYKGLIWKVSVSEASTITVYADNNGNGKFDDGEAITNPKSVEANTVATLDYTPSDDYYGVLYWKVEAVSNTSNLKVSTTNVSKIKRRPDQEKMYVNLLQIMAGRTNQGAGNNTGSNNYSTRSLFLCTECQFTKNVLHGNRYTNLGMFNSKVDSGVNTFMEYKDSGDGANPAGLSDTNKIANTLAKFEPGYVYDGRRNGVHTHDFGISIYYTDLVLPEDNGKGYDDVSTNWFNLIKEDYDVDTTIWYTNQFEDKMSEVHALFENKTDEQIKELIGDDKGGYVEQSNTYNTYYRAMRDLINGKFTKKNNTSGQYELDSAALDSAYPGFSTRLSNVMISSNQVADEIAAKNEIAKYATASFKLDDFISDNETTLIGSTKLKNVSSDRLKNYLGLLTDANTARDKRKYYDLYNNYSDLGDSWVSNYSSLYEGWRDAKIFENFFFEMYQKYLLYSSYDVEKKEVVLGNVYDCIAIGAAEGFDKDDIRPVGTDALSRYIDDDKNLFLFHDTLSSVNGATTNLTQALSSKFGMNARHMHAESQDVMVDNGVSLTVNGKKLSTVADMNQSVGERIITLTQNTEAKETKADSVKYNIGGSDYTFDGFSGTSGGYDVNVKTSVVKVQLVNGNGNGDIGYLGNRFTDEMVFSSSVTDVNITLNCKWGNPNNGVTSYTYTTSGSNSEPHDITLHIKCTAVNDQGEPVNQGITSKTGLPILINGRAYASYDLGKSTTYTIASNIISSGAASSPIEVTSITPKGALSGNGVQTFDFHFVDQNGQPLSGQNVSYVIDGKSGTTTSDSSGLARFTRTNYAVKDFAVKSNDSQPVSTSNGKTDSQSLKIKVVDPSNNPVASCPVSASNDGKVETKYTDGNGEVTFYYSNYIQYVSPNAIITRDAGYSKNMYYVSSVLPDPSTGKETFNFSPRMLAFKGFFVYGGEGQLQYPQLTMMYKYGLYHSKVDEASNISANIGQNHLQEEIASCSTNGESIPTDKTKQNNQGIITLYPFGIGSSMKVSATTPQSYPVDIEDDKLVVYYTLAGGTPGTSSSAFAADPMDGVNNYFLYQYGNITYTGAGHMKITGFGLENNDERRLFINVIVNSGRKSLTGPSLELFDLPKDDYVYELNSDGSRKMVDGHYVINEPKRINVERTGTNSIIKAKPGVGYDYYTEIEDLNDFKGFDYLATLSAKTEIAEVLIYYDVDHNEDGKDNKYTYDEFQFETNDDGSRKYVDGELVYKTDSAGNKIPLDRLIFLSGQVNDTDTSKQVLPNKLKSITTGLNESLDESGNYTYEQAEVKRTNNLNMYNASDPMLALREEFFDTTGEGGQYAYIIVRVTDSAGNQVSKTLRIQRKAELIDLN